LRYKLIDIIRRRGGSEHVQIDELAEVLPAPADEDGTDRHDMARILDKLGSKQRALLQCISIEGCSMREAAEKLQMNEGAVRVALHRTLKKLAALCRDADA
jgi:RNA polymerase sigma-70 factor (ECF subfamily)